MLKSANCFDDQICVFFLRGLGLELDSLVLQDLKGGGGVTFYTLTTCQSISYNYIFLEMSTGVYIVLKEFQVWHLIFR